MPDDTDERECPECESTDLREVNLLRAGEWRKCTECSEYIRVDNDG